MLRIELSLFPQPTLRTSRKNEKHLHTWSFYQLSRFIEYKAKLAGISVVYVDPKYTSQHCPQCGTKNKARDRKYVRGCGYVAHRDRVGALNMMKTPMADGVA
jgi:putative transposase